MEHMHKHMNKHTKSVNQNVHIHTDAIISSVCGVI